MFSKLVFARYGGIRIQRDETRTEDADAKLKARISIYKCLLTELRAGRGVRRVYEATSCLLSVTHGDSSCGTRLRREKETGSYRQTTCKMESQMTTAKCNQMTTKCNLGRVRSIANDTRQQKELKDSLILLDTEDSEAFPIENYY